MLYIGALSLLSSNCLKDFGGLMMILSKMLQSQNYLTKASKTKILKLGGLLKTNCLDAFKLYLREWFIIIIMFLFFFFISTTFSIIGNGSGTIFRNNICRFDMYRILNPNISEDTIFAGLELWGQSLNQFQNNSLNIIRGGR